MQKNSDIQFLHNNEIDKQQWDECIASSPNGLIYARSFYLDNLCPNWSGLTGEHYNWVLPITHNNKWGISYLYQPPFTQQLGVFAKANINPPVSNIISRLKKHFKFWEINWNYSTDIENIISPVPVSAATNFVLNLSDGYDRISENYDNGLRQALNLSKQFKHHYQQSEDYNKCIEMYRKNYGSRIPHVKTKDYARFSEVCRYALEHEMIICREVVNENGEIAASVLLLHDEKRIYNIINVTTESGRKTQANRFLFDSVIREFSGRELLLDFEGSDLPGVNFFYKSFGAKNQPYFMLKYNALPWPLKLLKK